MWYKLAQGFGGGILSPVEIKLQQDLISPVLTDTEEIINPDANIVHNPVQEPTNEYEQRIWDALVNRQDAIGVDGKLLNDEGDVIGNSPGVDASEARRLSPYHLNPEETTMEEQLEAVRHETVNSDEPASMGSTENSRGYTRVRGEFPYTSGKGWTGYEDLPADKSWA